MSMCLIIHSEICVNFGIPEIPEIEFPEFNGIKLFKKLINLQEPDKPETPTSRLYMHFSIPSFYNKQFLKSLYHKEMVPFCYRQD